MEQESNNQRGVFRENAYDQPDESCRRARKWDRLCDQFEHAWQTGPPPRIEDYLAQASSGDRGNDLLSLLFELIALDLVYRWRLYERLKTTLGQQPVGSSDSSLVHGIPLRPRLEDYVAQFPQLDSLESLPISLVVEEYRARLRSADGPTHEEYSKRYPHLLGDLMSELARVDRELAAAIEKSRRNAKAGLLGSEADTWSDAPWALGGFEPSPSSERPDEQSQTFELSDTAADCLAPKMVLISGEGIPRYRLIEHIGAGSFASVWKAIDLHLGRPVAIKMPHREMLTPSEKRAILREAQLAASLEHPNLVTVYGVTWWGEQIGIVSQWIDGVTLDVWMRERTVGVRQAAQLVHRLATTMQQVHEAGIVHRDLKPGNILMDENEEPHITDFGLAMHESATDSVAGKGLRLGTPAYMAPEQARGAPHLADQRSDVYSLGVLLYQLLTGERPFRGSVEVIVHAILHEEPAPPRRLNRSVDLDLQTICLKCLEKSPAKRYQSAAELAEDLERYLAGQPIRARPVGRAVRAARWIRRNPSVAGLSAVCVLLLCAVAAAAILGYMHSQRLLREARANLYFSEIANARQEWLENHVRHCHETLARCPQEHRGWAWGHLRYLCHSEKLVLQPAGGSIAFTPDGSILAAAGGPVRDLRLWDFQQSVYLGRLPETYGRTGIVAISHDGRLIAANDRIDGSVRIWDVKSRRRVYRCKVGLKGVTELWFLPGDQQLLAVEPDAQRVSLISTNTLAARRIKVPGRRLECGALSPDGTRVALGCRDGTIWTLDLASEQFAKFAQSGVKLGGLAWSPDGSRLASAERTGQVVLWEVKTASPLMTCSRIAGRNACVVFSHDGQKLACDALDRTVRVWDARTGKELFVFRGHEDDLRGIAFSPDDRYLAAASTSDCIRVWDATSPQGVMTLATGAGAVVAVAFDSTGRLLAAPSDDHRIRIWRADTGELLRILPGHDDDIAALVFSPHGHRLASGSRDRKIKLWDAMTGRLLRVLVGCEGNVRSLAFHPKGRLLASAGQESALRLWDTNDGRQIRAIKTDARDNRGAAFSPNGKTFALASRSGTVICWDVASWTQTLTYACDGKPLWAVAFSPDGQCLLAGSASGSVYAWNMATKRLQFVLPRQLDRRVVGISFSHSGTRFVTAIRKENVKLWHTQTGRAVFTLATDLPLTGAVAFSPNGRRIAAGTSDGRVLVWTADPY